MTRGTHDDVGAMLDRSRSALAVVDSGLHLQWGNDAFFRWFPGARLGESVAEVAGPWLSPRVRPLPGRTATAGAESVRPKVAGHRARSRPQRLTVGELPSAFVAHSILLCVAQEERAGRDSPQPRRVPGATSETLAAEIAHEFSNLLVGVLGYAALAEQQLAADSRAAASVRSVQQAARRAVEITDRLLMYSGSATDSSACAELEPILEEAMARIRRECSGEIELELRMDSSGENVPGDGRQWRKIIAALLDNAAAAIGGRGTILIEAGAFRVRPDTPDGDAVSECDEVRIRIADDGIGMDAATLRQACEPFFSLDRAGFGLGLAASHGYVGGLGGTLSISSKPGGGTTVEIVVPRVL